MVIKKEKLWNYLRHDKKRVTGWLQRVDAEIIGSILEFQNQQSISGSCVEIGVLHGKSFIPLCMSLEGEEKALCIDIFDDQSKNLDFSGKGDIKVFQNNLDRFEIDSSNVRIYQGSSQDINYDDILAQVGLVRYFSIDGGHWNSIVQNDLILAEKTLAKDGVIALDDYCRAEWPEVTAGYSLWFDSTNSDIIPFAVGSNKLYLCRKDYASIYRSALKTTFLKKYFVSSYRSEKAEIDSYRLELVYQDETKLKQALTYFLKIFRPDIYISYMDKITKN